MKNRLLPLLLALVLVLGLLPAAGLTAGAVKAWENEITVLNKIEADLVAAIRTGKTSISVLNYGLKAEDVQLTRLKDYSPYISNGIDIECSYNSVGKTYTKIDVTCPMSRSEVNRYFDEVKAKVAEVDAMLAAVPTDADKVLVLHDYLAYRGEYDRSATVPQDSFNTAGLLLRGYGVCQAYASAMMYFLNRAGVECFCVESVLMNHTWNVVKIGGDYYHVDPTWDDALPDVLGMAGHKFLLLSDDAISAKRAIGSDKHHFGYGLPVACDSAEFDRAYWYGADSPIVLDGSSRYFFKDGSLMRRDIGTGTETALLQLEVWQVWGDEDAYYDGEFYTGLCMESGKLYYNTATEIRSLDVGTLREETVFTADTGSGFIYGSALIDGVMYYDIRQEKKDTGVRHCIPFDKLKRTEGHEHRYAATVTAPTCTEEGYTTHACACGDSWKDGFVKATGHSWNGTVTPPTCTAQGYTTHTCAACGSSFTDSYVAALGHSYKNGVCARCGAKQPDDRPDDPTPVTPTDFNDVKETAWYYDAVNYAVSKGLMNGVGNNNFAPNDPMTRAMLVTVLWRYEGEKKEGANGFSDVPAGQWYTDAVAWAAYHGIVGGVGNNQFAPNGNITREQMAAILFRYANGKGFDTSKRGDLSAFSDQGRVSAYAVDAIAWTVAEGIIGGADGKLDPRGNATRAQVSTILMRFIENIAKKQ